MKNASAKFLQQVPVQIAAGAFESNFATRCWSCGTRADGRDVTDIRPTAFKFDGERGQCVLTLGKTAVMATVQASLVVPSTFSPRSGFFDITTRIVPIESRMDPRALQQHMDRLLRNPSAPALDVGGLCVIPGSAVWSVQLLVVVLADAGNVIDAASWASVAALSHFRRDEVAVSGDTVRRFSPHERDPVPLAMLHVPVSFTFLAPRGFGGGESNNNNNNNNALCTDPTSAEEQTRSVTINIGCNSDGQVYFCHASANGAADGFSYEEAKAARQQAKALSPLVTAALKQAMDADAAARKARALSQFEWAQTRVGVR